MARGFVQLVRRIPSGLSDRLGYACRRKTCLVSQTAFRTVSGIRRTDLDVFWRNRSALVRDADQPVMPLAQLDGKASRMIKARKSPPQWKQLRWKRCRDRPPSPNLRRT